MVFSDVCRFLVVFEGFLIVLNGFCRLLMVFNSVWIVVFEGSLTKQVPFWGQEGHLSEPFVLETFVMFTGVLEF